MKSWDEKIKDVVVKNVDTDMFDVYFFGSRIGGTNSKWSDYDVAVVGKKGQKLSSLVRFKIEEELERLKVPYKIDLVDFFHVTTDFKNFSLKEAIKWA
ncbi:nucleotidyltransferase domain-containing protein [Patescibacteria group bacterium]|nr:nucleotidyltransferase domain-containing protein [Patescibacteria group bacterium]MCG2702511.1 nucleotidyltransferase domain-containing protein [Candidatus Parcubacteria bacterium]MBU4264564.1 nucleotidyltransferase domain-containing protein [Patescibacteria group bacterium]MBU4390232.1 nucleotidyltransferase domain-containing protein [Patescibacteria group bacterium]MBU4397222.1 nucleotidyltransferase domain-containing protein [Patescibacteria group bacterium]